MNHLEIVRKYMDILFNNGNPDELEALLTPDLQFKGPFFQFESAIDYINSLKADPPLGFRYQTVKSYIDENSVCLIYEFTKSTIKTPMMQMFEFEKERISKILLVFDTAPFDQ